jgi:hypothetical protein
MRLIIVVASLMLLAGCEKTIHEARMPVPVPTSRIAQ